MISKEELAELIEELEIYKGRATELVTVYIPAGQNIYTVADQLEAEKSTAKNIKSTSTRKNVGNALDKITRYLKDYKKTPENGLAIFCGNISKVEGQEDLRLWDMEPPMPLKVRMYRCDKEFILDPLREMNAITEVFGLLVMDRKEATIGLLEGKSIEVLQKMTSGVPSKVRAGGQCLFQDTIINVKRKGDIKINDVKKGDLIKGIDFNNMNETYNKCLKKWLVNKNKSLLVITNGDYPSSEINSSLDHIFYIYYKGKIKETIASKLKIGDFLIGRNNKLIKILSIDMIGSGERLIDLEVENKNFFANEILVHNSSQRFHRITEGLTKEFYKRIADEMKNIFYEMPKLKGILIGGPVPTKDEFLDGQYLPTRLQGKVIGRVDIGGSDESGLKELVQRSQDILAGQEIVHEKKILERFFQTLGEKPELAALKEPQTLHALEYGAVDLLVLSRNIGKAKIKELSELAKNTGASVEIISIETEEGQQFANMGGIGAILRFRVQ
ncbi:MAG: hypothetical protein AABW50_01980 [Nanoarchaeota archaeon]